jgi:hypothetical protein
MRMARDGVAVHWSRCLERVDRVAIGAVLYTTKARTICDLTERCDGWSVLTLVDNAIAAGGEILDDSRAPAYWVLADGDGNRACVCTWQEPAAEPA